MASLATSECFVYHGWFAGPGISIGRLDPSLGVPADWRAGEVCDRHLNDAVARMVVANGDGFVTARSGAEPPDSARVGLSLPRVRKRSPRLVALSGSELEASRIDALYCGTASHHLDRVVIGGSKPHGGERARMPR
jgi:hypothetical protein